MGAFQRAVKEKLKLRMAIFGPTGSGKTYTALKFADALGGKIAYIDSENRSSVKYLGQPGIPEFDIAEMTYQGDARRYIDSMISLIKQAETEYDVIVIDSMTHAWEATKDEVNAVAARMKKSNTFSAWREGSTLWGGLIKALLNCKAHLIVCARSKTEYVLEQVKSRNSGNYVTEPRKVGLAPELRDGFEYELDIVGEIDHEHNMVITKSRCFAVADAVIKNPDGDFLTPVKDWLNAGVEKKAAPSPEKQKIYDLIQKTDTDLDQFLSWLKVPSIDDLDAAGIEYAFKALLKKEQKMNEKAIDKQG